MACRYTLTRSSGCGILWCARSVSYSLQLDSLLGGEIMYPYYRTKTKISLQWVPGPRTVKIPYDATTVIADVPDQAGVYILDRRCGDNSYRSFYVGQANSLTRRMQEHLFANEPNGGIRSNVTGQCGFRFAVVASSAQRDAAEAAVYRAHPDWYPCNDSARVPSVSPDYDVDIGF